MISRRTFVAGAAATLATVPRVAWGQAAGPSRRIAIFHLGVPPEEMTETGNYRYHEFFPELRRLGWVEGQNLTVDRWSGAGQVEAYVDVARKIVDSEPEIIVSGGARAHCEPN